MHALTCPFTSTCGDHEKGITAACVSSHVKGGPDTRRHGSVPFPCPSLSFLFNVNLIYMRWRRLNLFIVAAYSPPSEFNDPKSGSVELINPCVQSHFPMPALFKARTTMPHRER